MKKRSRDILISFENQRMPFTIEECAEQFGISPRTVRHDIQEINDFLSSHGYKALGIDGTTIINPMSDVELQGAIEKIQGFYCYKLSPEERQLLIQIMLIHGEGYQTYSQIADELMVSRVTIINDLVKVKAWFAYRNLQVESLSNKGIRLCGTEISRRRAIIESVSSVYGSVQEKPVVVEYIEDLAETAFSKDTVEFLRCQIIRQEAIHGNYLTDQSFTILIFYLSYVFFRISQGKVVQLEDGGPGVNRMAVDLLESMGEYWGMDMPEGEAQFLSLILDSLHYIKKSKRDEKIIMLQIQTRRFIEIISTALKLDLNHDYVFYQDLANHLESIIVQHCHMPSNNAVVRQIAQQNKVLSAVVKENIGILEKNLGHYFDPDEQDYIIVHFCAAMERLKWKEHDFRVVVVCGNGMGTAQVLTVKLRSRFNFNILGVTSVHGLQQMDCREVDLIITTTALKESPCPYIVVSPLISEADVLRISRAFNEITEQSGGIANVFQESQGIGDTSGEGLMTFMESKLDEMEGLECQDKAMILENIKGFFENYRLSSTPFLHELLIPEHIVLDMDCSNYSEAIAAAGQILLDGGFIDGCYIEAMVENIEKNGPYIVVSEGFAVPHAGFDAGSKAVGMSLIRLENPVDFNTKTGSPIWVDYVCCLSTVDDQQHLKAFFHLVNILTDPRVKEDFHRAESPKQFAQMIKDYELKLILKDKERR